MLGLPSLWTVLLSLLVNIGDKLIIVKLFSKADVAHYSLAFDVNTKAYLILGAINSAMYAVMIRNRAIKRSSSTQIRIGLITVGVVGFLYYLPLALFSNKILTVWVSPEFGAAAAHLVPVFALASLAYLCGNVFEVSLLANGLSVKVFQIYCVAVSLYFITCILLVNWIGLSAFAWAYVVMNMAMFTGTSLSYRVYTAKYKT
jgi:O-antigen/teichoic acid export membrane protein